MPLLFALMASAVIHASLLLSDGWTLPGSNGGDELDVVLTPAAAAPTASLAPPAKPKRVPASKPTLRPPAEATHAAATANGDETLPAVPAATPVAEPEAAAPPPAEAVAPAAVVATATLPAAGVWRYRINRGEGGMWVGSAEFRWQQAEGRYQASSRAETVGLAALFVDARVEQFSQGVLEAGGLSPDEFRQVRKKRSERVRIDRAQGLVHQQSGENERTAPLAGAPLPVQDMLSMYFQLGLRLAADPAPAEISLHIASGRKLETYRFERVDSATLRYQYTDYPIQHLRARNGADLIELWFAPTHAPSWPLPLRMRFADRKGEVYEQWLELPETP